MRRVIVGVLCASVLLWLGNSSWRGQVRDKARPELISHRGVHQIYAGQSVQEDTCTAHPIREIEHTFIENTLPSMQKAFDWGASVVELDIHLTPDNVFAVFHDWTLDCRTDGTGQTNQRLFIELQKLDVGYGYTTDGVSFPLRGTGSGMMPRLEDVFAAFPDKRFLINFKSKRRAEGEALAALLQNPQYRNQVFAVYGGQAPTRAAIQATPGLRGFDRNSVKSCLLQYALIAWTGWVPQVCRSQILAVPINLAPALWGWPALFQQRMAQHNTAVILLGPYTGDRRTRGIDSIELINQIPDNFYGYVWTNEIELFDR